MNSLYFAQYLVNEGVIAEREAKELLKEGNLPEAIVCANDNMAIAVSDELQKAGYRIPEDVIVTGFDGERKCLFKSPSISTVTVETVPLLFSKA